MTCTVFMHSRPTACPSTAPFASPGTLAASCQNSVCSACNTEALSAKNGPVSACPCYFAGDFMSKLGLALMDQHLLNSSDCFVQELSP